jgi:hypothetical protein
MVKLRDEHRLVELYLVAFGVVDVDVEGWEEDNVDGEKEEEYERQTIYKSDSF